MSTPQPLGTVRTGGAGLRPAGPDPAAKASGGMFTALSMILLTLVVYLFSLTLPDDARRRAIHASLAKAFLFEDRGQDRIRPQDGPTRLLAPGRQALRALEARLAAGGGRVDRVKRDVVVTLDGDALFVPDTARLRDRAGVLGPVARLVAATAADVRVEAEAQPDARGRALDRAVAVARDLVARAEAGGDAVDTARLSAAGLGTAPAAIGAEVSWNPDAVRVVLVGAEGEL